MLLLVFLFGCFVQFSVAKGDGSRGKPVFKSIRTTLSWPGSGSGSGPGNPPHSCLRHWMEDSRTLAEAASTSYSTPRSHAPLFAKERARQSGHAGVEAFIGFARIVIRTMIL